MKTIKRKRALLAAVAAAAALALLAAVLTVENNTLELTEIKVRSGDVPESFFGYRIAQISDLHNAEFGEGNEKLLALIEEAEPNIIVVTGDLIDSRRTDVDTAVEFMEGAVKIAPCYYVVGNHEKRVPKSYGDLSKRLCDLGVTVLENEAVNIENGEDSFVLAGLWDYSSDDAEVSQKLSPLVSDEGFSVVLSHRPEHFSEYVEGDADLVFCGHAHGGQIRLPFVGGVLAPGQGLFPEYSEGTYTEDGTLMIVSRGIGNSLFPFRINNRPEVVVAELWGE